MATWVVSRIVSSREEIYTKMHAQHPVPAHSNYRYLIFCLFSPVLFGLLRKFLPGQPSYIEALSVFPILLVILLLGGKIFPKGEPFKSVSFLLLLWVTLQIIFAFLSAFDDFRVGLVSIFTRVVPVFLAWISYYLIKTKKDFILVSKYLTGLSVILLPLGLLAAVVGNSALPLWLRPIDKIVELGRDFRSGVQSISLIFTSQWIFSVSLLAILFLGLSNLILAYKTRKSTLWWWFANMSSLLLLYLSTRRAMFIAGVVGFFFMILFLNFQGRKKYIQILVFAVLVISAISYIDQVGYLSGKSASIRTEWFFNVRELSLEDRINGVFFPIVKNWISISPFGNYLGFAGPESRALGVSAYLKYSPVVEVGAALLVAEMGILGLVAFPLINLSIVIIIWKQARKTDIKFPIMMLLLFFVIYFVLFFTKELLDLANVSIGQFFYWSVIGLSSALVRVSQKNIR